MPAAQTFLQQLQAGSDTERRIQAMRSRLYSNSIANVKNTQNVVMSLLAQPDFNSKSAKSLRANMGKPSGSGGNTSIRVAEGTAVSPVAPGKGTRGGIVRAAEAQLGRPYVWGGSNPSTSFDCSGLVQWAYKRVGINLPRVSADQARYGRRVALNQLRPGDLVAWDNSSRNNGADHIAVYIGGGKIIEAPRTGLNVRVRALGSNEGAWGVQVLK